ncbi:MAG TPA: VWA domain-containing protein [Woeseiaceae bacterium]|nr:VWA domain-containing protein [Woeseiaceae bacterium]
MRSALPCWIAALYLWPAALAAQEITLEAPDAVTVGTSVEIRWQGGSNPQDFITIVPADAPAGKYEGYQYAAKSPVSLVAPAVPGNYEIRYLAAASPYATLAKRPLTINDTVATLEAAATVPAGDELSISWSGPDNPMDFITLVPVGTAEGQYAVYAYTNQGSPLTLRAPDVTGEYELRYLLGSGGYRTLGRRAVTVTGTSASLEAPETIAAGSPFTIDWQGPNNAQDYITIVPAGTAAGTYKAYVYTAAGNPARMTAPEVAGDYEIRYLTGQSYATLAARPLTVTAVSATLDAPPSALARDAVSVTWEGPGNPLDYIVILPVNADNNASGPYAYVSRGKTLRIATPNEPGDYELRYVTSSERLTLGKRSIAIAPRDAPGELRVLDDTGGSADLSAATVAVVLDASGSMLQRLEGERRIDIAKAAITELVNKTLPQSVAFTLRVFGHKEADSCRSDLEIPLGPLDRARASSVVASIQAMNLARTPIAESLRLAAGDAAGHSGPLLIILVTDGEETCDGDPAAVIRQLAASGTEVRVNIVGFAIDELMLQETFAEWARLGNGRYFNAADGEELTAGLRESVEQPYTVVDAEGRIVASGTVNGPPVPVPAGSYRVLLPGSPERAQDNVLIQMETLTEITL